MPPNPLKSWIVGQLEAVTRQAEALRLLAAEIARDDAGAPAINDIIMVIPPIATALSYAG